MSGQEGGAGKSRVREGERYEQLDSIHIPQPGDLPGQPEAPEEGVGGSGRRQSKIGVSSEQPESRVSHPSVEEGAESQGAVATGGGRKKRKSFKHAFKKKIIGRITGRNKRVSSSSSDPGIQRFGDLDPQSVVEDESCLEGPLEEDPQGTIEDESCLECTPELEKELRMEWEKQVGEMEAEWSAKMDSLKGQMERDMISLREERDRALGEAEEAERARVSAAREKEQAKKNSTIMLRKKAKELEEKDATIKSLQADVEKLKQSEESAADLRKKNLEMRGSLRHKEGLERLQQGKIDDLEKEVGDQKQHIENYRVAIDKHNVAIALLKEDLEAREQQLEQAREQLNIVGKEAHHEAERAREEIDRLKTANDQHEVASEQYRAVLEAKEQQRAELKQAREEIDELKIINEAAKERHQTELERVKEAMQRELGLERERGRRLEDEGERVKGELQEVNSELEKLAEGEAEEKMAEPDQDLKGELKSLQHELELVQSELKEEKAKVSELQSKLKADGEPTKPSLAEAGAIGSERNQLASDEAYSITESGRLKGSLRKLEATANLAKLHPTSIVQDTMTGEDKPQSPHTSLGEEKSPYSSLGEVKLAVMEDNMTDADKWGLQEMLKESHEELERLWNHNKTLVERLEQHEKLKACGPLKEGEIAVCSDSQKVAELTERLRAYEQQLSYPPKPATQETNASTETPAMRKLKNDYLNLHSQNAELREKVEERDAQLKQLREAKLTVDADYPVTERSLSFEGLGSPQDLKAEVERLKSVVVDREKKIGNLMIQVNSFQGVSALSDELPKLKAQISDLQSKLKASEEAQKSKAGSDDMARMNELLHNEVSLVREQLGVLEREKQDAEKAQENHTCGLRDQNLELQHEVARLKSALTFWESKQPEEESAARDRELKEQLNKIVTTELENKISRKDAAIQNLTDSRHTLESRMARLREERDRYAQQNTELLAVRANLKGKLDHYGENLKERALELKKEIAAKLLESEGLKKEKEMMTQEILDLQNELEARKVEVDLVKEDFEKEREQRQNMASRLDIEFGKWRVREQEFMDQLECGNNEFQEQVERMNTSQLQYQEDLKRLENEIKCLTTESEQREFQLTAKLDNQTAKAVKLQREMDEQCDRLREERDVMHMEMNKAYEMYDEKKKENQEIVAKLLGDKEHMEAHMTNMAEQIEVLQVQKQSMEDCIRRMEDEMLKNEKLHETTAAMKRDLENQLHDATQQFSAEREQLVTRLSASDQQRKHDYAQWMVDRQELEGAIKDTARLSDDVMTLEQQLKHFKTQAESYKVKFQEEKSRMQQLLKEREEEHRAEVNVMKAQCESDKMDQERLLTPLRREVEQLRSQAGQRSPSNRVDARELEALKRKHEVILDGFTVARDLLIKHNIPFPKQGFEVHETLSAKPNPAYMVRPYSGASSQTFPPSVDGENSPSTAPAGFHRLSDTSARGQAFSTTVQHAMQSRMVEEDNIRPQGTFPTETPYGYSNTPHGGQQNIAPQNVVQQKMLEKGDFNKSGGYGAGEKSPNLRAMDQHFQTPVVRAGPAYNQQVGGGIHPHALQQQAHAPVSNAEQRYQQQPSPHYPTPQQHPPQHQQGDPQPNYAQGHGYTPQQQPPTNPQGARPPNQSILQENLLLKDIDTDISQAAADMQMEVQPQSMAQREDSWPLDSNLICPMCKRQFRIGQIQHYKKHVDECEGEEQ